MAATARSEVMKALDRVLDDFPGDRGGLRRNLRQFVRRKGNLPPPDRAELADALEDFAIQFEDEAARAQIGAEVIGYMAGGSVGVSVSAFGLLAAGATVAFPLVLVGGLLTSTATLLGYRRERLRHTTQAGIAEELRAAAKQLMLE